MKKATILLLDVNPASGVGNTLRGILDAADNLALKLHQETVDTGDLALSSLALPALFSHYQPDVTFLIVAVRHLRRMRELLSACQPELGERPLIIVTDGGEPYELVEALSLGVADFLTPPLRALDVLPRVWRLLEQRRCGELLTHTLKGKLGLSHLIGESPLFRTEIKKLQQIAKCEVSALITGETGTGKELCARAIHYLSPRTGKSFIPISCGAIPVELVENELFGHTRGAFTNASTTQSGLIHEAEGGTLFLDEVDSLPALAQVKLLRFLQE